MPTTIVRKPFEPTGTTVTFLPDGETDAIAFPYISVTPPEVKADPAIDTTLLSTTEWRTKMSAQLKDSGTIPFKAEYVPKVVTEAPVNVDGLITVNFPGQGKLEVRGYLDSCKPDELVPGTRATMSGEFVVTNTATDGVTTVAPNWTDEPVTP